LTGAGRVRWLVVGVAVVSGCMVGALRWVGRLAAPGVEDRDARPAGDPGPAGAGETSLLGAPMPDLTFYKTLQSPSRGDPGGAAGRAGASDRAAAPAGGAYVVQALATRDARQARRVRDRIASWGYPAAIVEEDGPGDVIYRVRVGRYRDREVAEIVARRVRSELGVTPWILQEVP